MADVLIRNVPEEQLARIDEHAARLGLSRGEYLRLQIARYAARSVVTGSVDDLARAAELARDLLDEEVMRDAWT